MFGFAVTMLINVTVISVVYDYRDVLRKWLGH